MAWEFNCRSDIECLLSGSTECRRSISKVVLQVGADAVGNVLKEFWPDVLHRFSKNRKTKPLTVNHEWNLAQEMVA